MYKRDNYANKRLVHSDKDIPLQDFPAPLFALSVQKPFPVKWFTEVSNSIHAKIYDKAEIRTTLLAASAAITSDSISTSISIIEEICQIRND